MLLEDGNLTSNDFEMEISRKYELWNDRDKHVIFSSIDFA